MKLGKDVTDAWNRSIKGGMDNNTAKVLLTAIVLAFVLAIMRQFDRVSLHVEQLRLDILGLLKLSPGLLKVAAWRRPKRHAVNLSRNTEAAAAVMFPQGSFARRGVIPVPGNHDIDINMIIIITHPDDDHLAGVTGLLRDLKR
jgi:hypothetical protein